MSTQVGAIVSASCSQCKATEDAEVSAVVGPEIVSVTCRTCGLSQRYRPPVADAGASALGTPGSKPRVAGRRVVDVGLSSEPMRTKPRSARRSDGDDIPLRGVPRAVVPTPTAIEPAPPAPPRPTTPSAARAEELFRRWDVMTSGLMSRHGRPHRIHETYREGEIVLHNVHGMGVVEGIDADGNLTVLFRRGYQTLPSGQTQHAPPARP